MKRLLSIFFLFSLVFGALPVFAQGPGATPHGQSVKKEVKKGIMKKTVKKEIKKQMKKKLKKDLKDKIPPVKEAGSSVVDTQVSVVAPASLKITIQNFAFAPSPLNLKVGDTVTWTNMDSAAHTVEADGGAFKSASLSTGATFSFTFATAGTFAYHCGPHPSMTGSIVVSQ